MKSKLIKQLSILIGLVIFIVATVIVLLVFVFNSDNNQQDDKDAIKLSVTYQGLAFISYVQNEPYVGLNGKKYLKGDLLPVWEEIEKRLDLKIKDVTPKSGEKEEVILNSASTNEFKMADIFNGKSNQFVQFGTRGNFIALNQYWDQLPNLKKFIDNNPTVALSLMANDGNIYYAPYFDGFNEVERMFLMRHDWVEKILDTDEIVYDTEKKINTYYQPTMPGALHTTIKASSKDIIKNYPENIITIQNNLSVKNGETLTNSLKTYLRSTYGNQFTKLSDIYLSADASYDADEMVALLRCVKANPYLLTGDAKTDIIVFFPRERSRDTEILSLLQIWGTRGVSQTDNSDYLGADGKFHDSVGELSTLNNLELMNQLYKEDLIMKDVSTGMGSIIDYRQHMFNTGHGFMTFDYNATTTMLHLGIQNNPNAPAATKEMKLQAVLPPVVDWLKDGNYFHFSESSRTVKTEGWGIPVHVLNNPTKLAKVLKIIDYPYSEEGRELVTYGPDAWRDGMYDYFGQEIPKLNHAVHEEIMRLASGNNSNYYRQYVGATLPIGYVKDMGMEYQTLTKEGKAGIELLNKAISQGALIVASADKVETNKFFQVSPTTYAFTAAERQTLAAHATFTEYWKNNRLYFVIYGFGFTKDSIKVPTKDQYLTEIKKRGYEDPYLSLHQKAWELMHERSLG